MDEARAFPAAADLLRRAHDLGLAVVLATSAPATSSKARSGPAVPATPLTAQTTADDVESSKPSPEVFGKAMKAFSIDPARPWPWVTASGTSRPPGRRASAASPWRRAVSASTSSVRPGPGRLPGRAGAPRTVPDRPSGAADGGLSYFSVKIRAWLVPVPVQRGQQRPGAVGDQAGGAEGGSSRAGRASRLSRGRRPGPGKRRR